MTILVVEDFVTNASIMRTSLAKIGHDVKTARDGAEALQFLQQQSFDMVITDWLMPKMDGFELIQNIVKIGNSRPLLVMVSSLGSAEAQEKVLDAGADAYLAKPVTPEQMQSVVTDLERQRSHKVSSSSIRNIKVQRPLTSHFDGVALVAGTGGATALRSILKQFTRSDNAAYFVVLHGPGWATAALTEKMKMELDLDLVLPGKEERLRPGVVYVAPGDKHLVVSDGGSSVHLSDTPPENYLRPSADPLLRSLAATFGKRAIAVVLGGTSCDAAIGCGYVKVAEGTVVVQKTSGSVASQMPQNVIDLGLADQVMSLEDIPGWVKRHLMKHA